MTEQQNNIIQDENAEMSFLGIDISKKYCEKALDRVNQITLPYPSFFTVL